MTPSDRQLAEVHALRSARRPHLLPEETTWWMRGLSHPGALAISLGLILCVSLGDLLTGPEVSFTLLYLGPIGFATWFAGLGPGALLSFLSAVASVISDGGTAAVPPPIQAWNLSVQLGVFLALAFLLAALKARLEAEQLLARTDPLTLLSNRRAFLESTGIELERARRTHQPLTVAYVDVDDFKRVNDELGHAEGDALLSAIAATLRGETRAVDAVARLGGDEFGLLLVDTDGHVAEVLLERLRAALRAVTREAGWQVTLSIGAVTFLSPPVSVDEMIGRADALMYATKRAGKDGLRHEVVQRSAARAVAHHEAGRHLM